MAGFQFGFGLGLSSNTGGGDPDGPQVAAYNQTSYLAIQAPARMYPMNDANGATVSFVPTSTTPALSVSNPGVGWVPGVYPLVNSTQTSTFVSRAGLPRASVTDNPTARRDGSSAFNQIVTICHFGTNGDDSDTPITFDHVFGCRATTFPFGGYGIGTIWRSDIQARVAAWFIGSNSNNAHYVLVAGSSPLIRGKAYGLGARYTGTKLASGVILYTETGGVITTETMTVLSDTMGTDSSDDAFSSWSFGGLPGSQTINTVESPDTAMWGAALYSGAMTDATMKQLLAARPARIQRTRNESATPPQIVWEDDQLADKDGVAASEVLIGAQKRGAAIVKSVNVGGGNTSAAPAVNAFFKSRGLSPQLSCYQGVSRPTTGTWQASVVSAFNLVKTRADFLDEIRTWRSALHNAADGSLTWLITGPHWATAAQLASPGDDIDSRDGITLAAAKFSRAVVMMGYAAGGKEFNVTQSIADAQYFVANCPVPVFVVSQELGASGTNVSPSGNIKLHPAKQAFQESTYPSTRGTSFDPIAAYFACYPNSSLFSADITNGTFSVAGDGTNSWSNSPGNFTRLTLTSTSGILGAVESLMGCAAMELIPNWAE